MQRNSDDEETLKFIPLNKLLVIFGRLLSSEGQKERSQKGEEV
jgi:hypothetical protein